MREDTHDQMLQPDCPKEKGIIISRAVSDHCIVEPSMSTNYIQHRWRYFFLTNWSGWWSSNSTLSMCMGTFRGKWNGNVPEFQQCNSLLYPLLLVPWQPSYPTHCVMWSFSSNYSIGNHVILWIFTQGLITQNLVLWYWSAYY